MTVKIEYFTDVLCVWAYLAQIRMDELKTEFTDEVDIEYRFIPIFGAAKSGIEKNWKEQGGVAAYNSKLRSMAKDWPHISPYLPMCGLRLHQSRLALLTFT